MGFVQVNAGRVHAWAPAHIQGAGAVTQQVALDAATRFDVLAGLPRVYEPYQAAMHASNPFLKLLLYEKGLMTRDPNAPSAVYARDAVDNKIQGRAYPGTFLLDPSSPEALVWHANELAADLQAASGFDGLFLDTLGIAVLGHGYMSAVPVNPATGRDYTADEWQEAAAQFAGGLRQQLGVPCLGNALRSGPQYYKPSGPSSVYTYAGLEGWLAEEWLRAPGAPCAHYPSDQVWRESVNMLADVEARGSFFAMVKLWSGDTTAAKDAWAKYAVASFLLGSGGGSYLSISYGEADITSARPAYLLDLGVPAGGYAKLQGVYQRSFSKGRVLLNTSTSTVTLPLGGSFATLTGKRVTQVLLPPSGCEILTA